MTAVCELCICHAWQMSMCLKRAKTGVIWVLG